MEGKFEVNLKNDTLEVTLKGGLDATNSPGLSDQLKSMVGKNVNAIVFRAGELDYIASAGLRVIIFSIQKILKPGGKAWFIGGQEDVLSVIRMTGLTDSLIIQDDYDA